MKIYLDRRQLSSEFLKITNHKYWNHKLIISKLSFKLDISLNNFSNISNLLPKKFPIG